MNHRKRLILLIVNMTAVSLTVAAIGIYILYRTALQQQKDRLVEIVTTRARSIEAIALHTDRPETTLRILKQAHRNFEGFAQTGEFTLGKRDGDNIVFLLSHRHANRENPKPVPWKNSQLAEPMRQALSGNSGIILDFDYRGKNVLAAHEPVNDLNWGIVAKIDFDEIQAPFIRAGFYTAIVAILVDAIGAWLFLRLSNPLVRRIEESEAQNRAILETAAEAIITLNDRGIIESFNSAASKIFGYSATEAIGQPLKVLIPALADVARINALLHPVHQGESNIDELNIYRVEGSENIYEFTAQRHDRRRFPLEISISQVPQYNREIFTLIARDITERKQAIAALHLSENKLREQVQREQLLNSLANQIRNSLDFSTILQTTLSEIRNLFQIDRCHFLWIRASAESPHAEVIHEVKDPMLPDRTGVYSFSEFPELEEFAKVFVKLETIRCDELSQCFEPFMVKFLMKLGYKSLLSMPLKTPGGDLGAVTCTQDARIRHWQDNEVELLQGVLDQLAIAIDQADLYEQTREAARLAQNQAEQISHTLHQLQQTQAQLVQNEKMSSLGQLVAGIAHEINNPVSFISGNLVYTEEYTEDLLRLLELYQDHYPHPDPEIAAELEELDLEFLKEDLAKITKSMKVGAARIRDLVLSLRNFSRLHESGMKAVDIHEGIESTLLLVRHRLNSLEDSPIQLIKNYGDLPQVECYAGALNQALMNILNNAIDVLSTGEPGQNPQIAIATEMKDSQTVRISIADNGPGMDENIRQKVFDPFFTTKPVGQGTGLGLSTSYQIITEQHGGHLDCSSQPGVGTEFIIEIPVER